MKKNLLVTIIIVALLILAAGFAYLSIFSKKAEVPSPKVTNFEECAAAGIAVQESYPRRCISEGKSYTDDIGNTLEKQDLIQLTSPTPNQLVKSPLNIAGKARGGWFFEASFPIKILDANGKVLGQIPAATTSDWMTDNFVPFSASLVFETSTTAGGTLVLEKDNPSGLPQNADSLKIPVKFK